MKISQQITSIETIQTAGELGALFTESSLVKKLLPMYNRKLRLKRELTALTCSLTPNGYHTLTIEALPTVSPDDFYMISNPSKKGILGFFRSKKQAKVYLSHIALEYNLCEKLLGLEKTNSECFGHRLERCFGACVEKESTTRYNMRFIQAVSKVRIQPWPFRGPIVIAEKNDLSGTIEEFIVDRWCVIGKSTQSTEGERNQRMESELLFDLDLYKILRTYLRNPKNGKKVKLVSQQELFSPEKSSSYAAW